MLPVEPPSHGAVYRRLRRQFERRHPEWFDPQYYRPLTLKERRARRMANEEERMERVMELAAFPARRRC